MENQNQQNTQLALSPIMQATIEFTKEVLGLKEKDQVEAGEQIKDFPALKECFTEIENKLSSASDLSAYKDLIKNVMAYIFQEMSSKFSDKFLVKDEVLESLRTELNNNPQSFILARLPELINNFENSSLAIIIEGEK